jgi:hypothetical protein
MPFYTRIARSRGDMFFMASAEAWSKSVREAFQH